jgi:predicted dehydrogenase
MKILVVGCGRMGMSHGFLTAALIGKKRVVFVDTSFLSRLVIKVLGFETFRSVADASKNNVFTHGVVTTPTFMHASVIESLCFYGIRKLFVEKPFTANIKDSRKVLSVCTESKIEGQVGYVYRFQQNIMQARALIDNGSLGCIVSYKAQLTGNVVQSKGDKSWRTSEVSGGGVIRDFGSHLIDTVNLLFGVSGNIGSVVREKFLSFDTEDKCSWRLSHDDYSGVCMVNWTDNSVRKATMVIEIHFSKGKVIISGNGLNIESDSIVSKPEIPSGVKFYLRGEEFSRQIEVFLGLTKRSDWSIPCDFREAFEVDRIIEELKKSELLS